MLKHSETLVNGITKNNNYKLEQVFHKSNENFEVLR